MSLDPFRPFFPQDLEAPVPLALDIVCASFSEVIYSGSEPISLFFFQDQVSTALILSLIKLFAYSPAEIRSRLPWPLLAVPCAVSHFTAEMPTDSKEDDILQTQHIYKLLCDWIEGNTPAPFKHLDLPDMLFLFSPYPSQVQTRQVDKVKIYSEDYFDKLLTRLPSNQRLHILPSN